MIIGWFCKLENHVVNLARVVLVLLGCLGLAAAVGCLVWTGVAAVRPTDIKFEDLMIAPTYGELREQLLPVPRGTPATTSLEATNGLQQAFSNFEGRLLAIAQSLDKQYQLVGRQERKFSEIYSSRSLFEQLVQPDLAGFLDDEMIMDHYLDALQLFATDVSNDELISRIADTTARTSTIIEALRRFNAGYVEQLENSVLAAAALSSALNTTKSSRLSFLLWSSLGTTLAFLIATIFLTMFRIERNVRDLVNKIEVAA